MSQSSFCECDAPQPGDKTICKMPVCQHCQMPINFKLRALEELLQLLAEHYQQKTGKPFFSPEG